MDRFRQLLPNLITLLNLLAGAAAIALIAENNLFAAAGLIWLAGFFDLADGALARWLQVHSALGKQLDSLADLVSFGLAPSFLLYHYLLAASDYHSSNIRIAMFLVSALLTLFTALRLARFNTSASSLTYFNGLPCPASGLLVASIPLLEHYYPARTATLIQSVPLMIGLIIVLSVLMISQIKLLSLKFDQWQWQGNQARWLFLGSTGLAVLLLHLAAVPLIALSYFLFSYLHTHENLFSRH